MSQETEKAPADVAGDAMALYSRLSGLLAAERLALCTILRLAGSGPRRAGAKMLVRESGGTFGTVGGGVLEMKTTTWAQEALQTGRVLCRTFALDLQQASDEGMTCGGEVDVLIEPLDGGLPAVRDFFAQVVALLRRGERGWLATTIIRAGEDIVTGRFLVKSGQPVASLPESGRGLPEDLLRAPAPVTPSLVERESVRYFLDPLVPPITVYVFGGGHIGMHLVPLCHLLGFRTVVADDRADFVSEDRFPQADELLAVPSFENALDHIPIGDNSYVVIITRGHGGDQAILRQALRRRPGYIGMIGSRRKRGLIYEQLAGEGFTPDDLSRVHCPVGLPIGAETPEEIAVSIAAELIATRAGRGEEV
jgi:xanthine dehydrogenase accessory factor